MASPSGHTRRPGTFALPVGGCYYSAMNKLLVLCLAALALGGCKSDSLSLVTAPSLMGRVVAADTSQPLAGVRVRRLDRAEDFNSALPPKGGERMLAKPAVWTDQDGRFLLETERVLTPFRGSGWFAVQLSFERPGYERYLTNYSYLNVGTNSWKGQSVLDAGKILLRPEPK